MSNNTFYLNCPYSEKDLVKSLGARWDADARKWYVPSGRPTMQMALSIALVCWALALGPSSGFSTTAYALPLVPEPC